jgi:hypothetical protein
MYKNVLQSIDNIAIWPVVSFIIFFLFFLILLWWAFTAKESFIDYMKNIPMDKTGSTSTSSEYEK